MSNIVTIAGAHLEPALLDKAATLTKSVAAIAEAAGQGARLVAFPAPALGLASAVIAPGGDIVTSSCRAGHRTATARVAELSAANGRLIRVLRTQTARFPDDADAQDAILATCQVLAVAGDGDHVLVQALAFGRIDNGVFTSLPGMSPGVLPVSATW